MLMNNRVVLFIACSFCLILSACSDENPAQAEANKEPYHPVFNPSPEQIAQRKAEERARLPFVNNLPTLSKKERHAYTEMTAPLKAMLFYTANRSWDESPERIAQDIGRLGTQVNNQRIVTQGVPDELFELTDSYSKATDAFEKADLAKRIADYVAVQSKEMSGNRLVKLTLGANLAPLQPYDMATRSFNIDTALFTDKTERTREEKEESRRTMQVVGRLKAHLFSTPTSYQYGFVNAGALESIKVENESIARKIEASRGQTQIVVYGYIARVQRAQEKGVPIDKPYTYVQPHFADIVSAEGETLYTVEL